MLAFKKPFKVPTFVDPTKAPTQTRTGVFTLGARRLPPVEAKAAHDYTMEGSIILYDPAWELLDEAQREEEKLLEATRDSTTNGEDTTPQVIIPKKKSKSKSIAEILGITKQKEQSKVHVVVSATHHVLSAIAQRLCPYVDIASNRGYHILCNGHRWILYSAKFCVLIRLKE
jgi:DNA repair and recombination RAD54-like protein